MRDEPAPRSVRAFFALELPAELLQAVTILQSALASLAPGLRWLGAAKLHLTLKFLGSVPETDLAALARGLDELSAEREAILARPTALAAFPSPRRAHVLVLLLEPMQGALSELAWALDSLAERFGVARETRPFKAHVTLARARPPADVRALLHTPLPDLASTCDRVRLYRSTPACWGRGPNKQHDSHGSTYSVLHECLLGPAAGFRAGP